MSATMTEQEIREVKRVKLLARKQAQKVLVAEASWEQYFQYFQFAELSFISDRFFSVKGEEGSTVPSEAAFNITREWLQFRWGDKNRGLEMLEVQPQVARAALMRAGIDLSATAYELHEVVAFAYYYQELHLVAEKTAGFMSDDLIEFKNLFKDFDEHGTGVKARELWAVLKALGYEFLSMDEQHFIIGLVKEADVDKSGSIDFTEFLHILRKLIDRDKIKDRQREHRLITSSGIALEECDEWLQIFKKSAGELEYIHISEMRALFRQINLRWDAEGNQQMMAWLREVDEDSNGRIDFGEFCCLIQKMWDLDFAGIRGRTEENIPQAERQSEPEDEEEEDGGFGSDDGEPEPISPVPIVRKRRTSCFALLQDSSARELDPTSPHGREMVQKFEESLLHSRKPE